MVIYVRGTSESRNSAYSMTALLAGEGAVKYNRKTIVIPFDDDRSIERYFIGKYLDEIKIEEQGFSFDDNGVDALFRRVDNTRLLQEHFDQATQPIFESKNLLDIPPKTNKSSLIDEIIKTPENVENLINYAKDIYDDVYLISRGSNEEFINILNGLADISLICIKQIPAENVIAPHEKLIYVVNEYDSNSVFNLKYMAQKVYKIKHAVAMPYNAEFKDAYNLGRLVPYLGKNQNISKEDVNYPLFHACDSLLEKIYNDEEVTLEEDKDVELVEEVEETDESINELDDEFAPEGDFVETKKGVDIKVGAPSLKRWGRTD